MTKASSSPSSTEITLRQASENDAYALWLWANDTEARAASFGRDAIEWSAHVTWLATCLHSELHLILIAALPTGQPVGVVRFDTCDAWHTARLSYAVAPEMRGRRVAAPLVEAGVACLRERHAGVAIRAEVASQSARSLRVFRGAGWTETADVGTPDTLTFWLR